MSFSPLSPPASPPRRSGAGLVFSVAAAAIALVAALGVGLWNFALAPLPAGSGGGGTVSPTPVVSPTVEVPPSPTELPPSPTAPPPTTEPPPTFPPGARPCQAVYGPIGGFTFSAIGSTVTSCEFAEEVRQSYGANPVRNATVIIPAYSPVTGVTYDMTCGGDRLVTCTGGNNAVVYLI